MAMNSNQPIEVCYSGGKDSDVILELTKMAGVNYRAIYKCTTIDPPYTIAHAKSKGVEIMQPTMRFFDIIRTNGFPNRRARFCCKILKEYKILDYAILGIRRCESVKRMARYKEPEVCRVYNRRDKARHYMPILDWTDDDVADFIAERGIQCHPLYYDEQGNFHVERRLGCMACPLKANSGLADFKEHPKLVRAWINAFKDYLETHPHVGAVRKFGDAYGCFYHNVFCKSYEDYLTKIQPDLWGNTLDCKAALEDYFGIKL